MLRRAVTGILTLALAATMFTAPAVQAAGEAEFKPGIAPIQIPEIRGEDAFSVNRGSLPAKYSSVSKKKVTSVKDQNPYGTCWSFAAINAMESYAISKGVKVGGRKATKSNIDLSEYHLAYFFFHKKTDPMGLIKGDYNLANYNNYLDNGSNDVLASLDLLNWNGPVLEKKAPYKKASPSSSLASKLAFKNDAVHLQNAYYINMSDTDKVKQAIMKYGSLAVAYCHDNDYYYDGTYYCPYNYYTNHAVSVVGWDDNFSASKFYYTPSSNGAWLIKNSWGTGWGNKGYFWISYEDVPLSGCTAVAMGVEAAKNYTYNYQYDGSAYPGDVYNSYNSFSLANVYKATGNQTLKAVGFGTFMNSQKATVTIYKKPRTGKPASGSKVTSKTVTIKAGFQTVKLSKAVKLSKGDKFSVVVKYNNASGENDGMVDLSYTNDAYVFHTTQKAGQSYLIESDGSIVDLASQYDATARIKAYTVKR